MCDDRIITLTDYYDDDLVVEESCRKTNREVFIQTPTSGVFLDVDQVKELRKALKNWLIDHGHKRIRGS